ncbi:MAG: L,D-transpeptidase family protein [Planctomycetota bacterium]
MRALGVVIVLVLIAAGIVFGVRACRSNEPEIPVPITENPPTPPVSSVTNPAAMPATPAPEPLLTPQEYYANAQKAATSAAKKKNLRKLLDVDATSELAKKAASELAALCRSENNARGALTAELKVAPATSEQRDMLLKKLDALNDEFFSPKPAPGTTIHIVQPGDVLFKIAKKYNTTPEFIQRLNGMKGTTIQPNQRLKVINCPVEIAVSTSRFTLDILINGDILKTFNIGVGAADKTPEGTFVITSRLPNPSWYKPMPDGRKKEVPPGDPENILGTRWLGFNEPYRDYGIHGSVNGEGIGKDASNGCVRMWNKDVEDVYSLIPMGTKVTITK